MKKIWSYICCSGVPWLIIFGIGGKYIIQQNNIQLEDKQFMTVVGVAWIFVVMKNLMFLGQKEISLFTWLEKYKYEPPEVSWRKRKAQHPPVDPEYLSPVPDGLVLGREGKNYVRFPIRKNHALSTIIIGTPGSGKSTLLLTTLIYQLQKRPLDKPREKPERWILGRKHKIPEADESDEAEEKQVFFILDCKPELMRKSSFPTDPDMRELSISNRSKWGWEPYERLYDMGEDAGDDEILSELDVIVRAFIETPKDSKNAFFYDSARAIFKFMALAEYKKGRSFMQTVDKLMDGNMQEVITQILENAEGKPELMKVRKGLNAYEGKKGEAMESIESTMRQSMEVFQKDSVKFFLDGNPRKLSPQTLEDKISVAFTIKTTQLKEYKVILRLVVMQLLHHCEDRDEDTSHLITLIIDEAFRLGVINWIDFLSVCRSKQVSCVLAFQSLSQMQSVWSKEDADSLLEMVSAIAVLSCTSENTAKMICSWAGDYYEEKISTNVGGKNDGSYSRSFETKKILEPTDLMRLKKAKEIVLFLDGIYYRVNVERAKYYKIPELNKISMKCVRAHNEFGKEKKENEQRSDVKQDE